MVMMSGTVYVLMFLFLPETYQPRLLQEKATRLGINASQPGLSEMLRTSLTRPIAMFLTEPILFLLSLYLAFLYGILYLDFTAYPFVFVQTRQWDAAQASLSFLGDISPLPISPLFGRLHPSLSQIHCSILLPVLAC